MNKIKLFSHTDADGVSCVILAYLAFGKENVDVTYCDYNNVNDKVLNCVDDEINNYDKIFITDISVNDTVATVINGFYEAGYKFQLLDHHPTALELNKYTWAKVQIEDEKEKVSGTSLFYNYILNYLNKDDEESFFEEEHSIYNFVEKIKRYDTWLWKTKYNDIEAKQLNDLLYIYGRDIFVDKFYNYLKYGYWYHYKSFLDEESTLLLKLESNKIKNYIGKKQKDMITKNLQINNKTYHVGIIFAEQYLSEVGNVLAEQNTDLDFIIMITNMNTISYRSIGDKIDLGKDIAGFYNGGGHPNAAGSQISEDIKTKIIDLIFE